MNANEMVAAYQQATVVVSRSGGTMAEIALFGLPSVLVPLPDSANNHQLHNAEEFVEIQATKLVTQSDSAIQSLADSLNGWLRDETAREQARTHLMEWDVPDATNQIWDLILKAAK